MSETIPTWAQELKAPRPLAVKTDAERIAAAKARQLKWGRELDADPNIQSAGFGHHPSYYTDYCGPETSRYAAEHLLCKCHLTHVIFRSTRVEVEPPYNSQTAVFDFRWAGPTSIQTLQAAYDARCVELGVRDVLIEERGAKLHSWVEDQKFYNLSFDEQMESFKEK